MAVKHFSHEHPLIVTEYKDDDTEKERICYACLAPCLSLTYSCHPCQFHLHKSCLDLPQDIHHFYHPNHTLTLQSYALGEEPFLCQACNKFMCGFAYRCDECHFALGPECALLQTKKTEGHEQIQHLSHGHPLTLDDKKDDNEISCSVCEKSCSGPTYSCLQCNFFIHKSCAELHQEIQHFFHPQHPLFLINNTVLRGIYISCSDCGKGRHNYGYICKRCNFYLDFKCALTPIIKFEGQEEIEHIFHGHPLTLTEEKDGEVNCSACAKPCSGLTYGCGRCNFFIHNSCAELPHKIQIAVHLQHPLTLLLNAFDRQISCCVCGNTIGGLVYSCDQCDFLLDVECALTLIKYFDEPEESHLPSPLLFQLFELRAPQEIQHLVHPKHSLTMYINGHIYNENQHLARPISPLTMLHSGHREVDCSACDSRIHGCAYHCYKCNFFLHVHCALMSTPKSEDQETIQHISHGHPLTLCEKEYDKGVNCPICEKHCSGPTYDCGKCNFFIHKSCAELSQKIQYYFHPRHSLTLQAKPKPKRTRRVKRHTTGEYCSHCGLGCTGYTFLCEECFYVVCVTCALEDTIISLGHGHIQHISHEHPLTLNEKNDEDRIYCKACEKQCFGSTYICDQCNFSLHKSCAQLSRELQHPFHPQHSLTLYSAEPYEPGTLRCDACKNNCTFFFYRCNSCNFDLDTDCASLRPSINYEGHVHLLTLFEKKCRDCNCNICGGSCDTFFLRCVECDYSLHIYCHPSFPQLVKHTCHIHPLNFINSQLQDDSYLDELYCDVCEKEEIIRDSYYYCSECNFIAHIGCVISEILSSLNNTVNMTVAIARELPIIQPPMIVKLNEEIEVLSAEEETLIQELERVRKKLEAVRTKTETLEVKRTQYIGSTAEELTE